LPKTNWLVTWASGAIKERVKMVRSHSLLVWLAAILTLISYITGAVFMSQGFLPISYASEQVFNSVIQVFAIVSVLACLAALFAMSREQTTA
jgi:cytochrome b subunit of formate dehydrogenase